MNKIQEEVASETRSALRAIAQEIEDEKARLRRDEAEYSLRIQALENQYPSLEAAQQVAVRNLDAATVAADAARAAAEEARAQLTQATEDRLRIKQEHEARIEELNLAWDQRLADGAARVKAGADTTA